MICLRFVLIWVVVCDGWPQDCAAFNGRHGDPEVIEPRAPPPLRRVEIHEESVDARPLGGEVTGILVMMPSVELADVIPDDLEWLHVANRRADEVGDAFCDAIGQRVAVTLVAGAPALVARAHRRQRVARETSLEMDVHVVTKAAASESLMKFCSVTTHGAFGSASDGSLSALGPYCGKSRKIRRIVCSIVPATTAGGVFGGRSHTLRFFSHIWHAAAHADSMYRGLAAHSPEAAHR
eukprot:CAMPEP_0113238610 /NCGR_PEP_ID=MMETSP0008_2-20120614/5240_1 /TAXON_ID=97485 /ORGANISM="Prymnesium parvum" /LENGTH=236 /DNA_ID=CAMNT_0000085733 /DNA_START=234 /DNA_END=942 /DNA_ORIENTATION=+ /assembly_acc=CAM_ASM_000153